MRRLRILFYWIFYSKNNIPFSELLKFMLKPKVADIAKRYIKSIEKKEFYEITFNNLNKTLYWPANFPIDGISQVTAETFDPEDWHFYQKEPTQIKNGEILLDIGTAEGLFPLTVVDKCEKIFLVEPSSHFNNALQKTFEDYQDKVTIFKTAVGNIDGEIGFDENSLAGQVSNDNESAKTRISKIDSLIAPNQKITFLKADIEGFEEEMLKGARLTITNNKPRIAITTYHKQNDAASIIALIKSYVPEYNHFVKGIHEAEPKPVMIHFWL